MRLFLLLQSQTAIVPSHQLSAADVTLLDSTPFGARVVKSTDVTLGLTLSSKHTAVHPYDENGHAIAPRKQKIVKIAQASLVKSIDKAAHRVNRLSRTLCSGPRRALFWTAYCQSTVYYVASVFPLSAKNKKQLLRLQQKALPGRAWIPMDKLAHVFSAFKMGPTTDPVLACKKANLAGVLRMHGSDALTTSSRKTPALVCARKTIKQWQSAAPENFLSAFIMHPVREPMHSPAAEKKRKQGINKIVEQFADDLSNLYEAAQTLEKGSRIPPNKA